MTTPEISPIHKSNILTKQTKGNKLSFPLPEETNQCEFFLQTKLIQLLPQLFEEFPQNSYCTKDDDN